MEYVVTGLNMMDISVYNGKKTAPQIGGIPLFGFCGLRLYTKNIGFVARVGSDFLNYYDPWFTDNNVNPKGLQIVSKNTPYVEMSYQKDSSIGTWDFFTGNWADANLWRPKGEDLEGVINKDTKGFYVSCGPQPEDIWPTVFDMKERRGYPFKVMWEPNGINTGADKRESTIELLSKIEMASFSLGEALRIFSLSTQQELIEFLKTQPCELIILRVGARGMYTITGQSVVFIPSAPLPVGAQVVDVTGCGNVSTAAAGYAWCAGHDLIKTGIMANVASSYNLRQMGPYPVFTDKDMADAAELVEKLYAQKAYTIVS